VNPQYRKRWKAILDDSDTSSSCAAWKAAPSRPSLPLRLEVTVLQPVKLHTCVPTNPFPPIRTRLMCLTVTGTGEEALPPPAQRADLRGSVPSVSAAGARAERMFPALLYLVQQGNCPFIHGYKPQQKLFWRLRLEQHLSMLTNRGEGNKVRLNYLHNSQILYVGYGKKKKIKSRDA